MEGIGALILLTAIAIAASLLLCRLPAHGDGTRQGVVATPKSFVFDRELAAMIDRGTAELTAERLADGPLLVPVKVGHRVLGPFLLVDTGTTHLRLRLYNDRQLPRAPAGWRDGVARLTTISYTDGQGWRFVFDGPRGPQRYLGWLVESIGK
jgi:hypothetical protein